MSTDTATDALWRLAAGGSNMWAADLRYQAMQVCPNTSGDLLLKRVGNWVSMLDAARSIRDDAPRSYDAEVAATVIEDEVRESIATTVVADLLVLEQASRFTPSDAVATGDFQPPPPPPEKPFVRGQLAEIDWRQGLETGTDHAIRSSSSQGQGWHIPGDFIWDDEVTAVRPGRFITDEQYDELNNRWMTRAEAIEDEHFTAIADRGELRDLLTDTHRWLRERGLRLPDNLQHRYQQLTGGEQ